MGLSERRCMITGVATGFAGPTVFIPLLKVAETYQPAALPLWGGYNGYGSIEGVELGPHSRRFQEAFVSLLQRGLTQIDWPKLFEEPSVPSSLDEVCSLLGRALDHDERAVTCDGRVLSFALVNGYVAEALLPDMPVQIPQGTDFEELVGLACGEYEPTLSVFEGIVREDIGTRSKFGSALADFLGLRQWLTRHEIAWTPPYEGAQYTQGETVEFLRSARERFADDADVLAGLEQYAGQFDLEN